MFRKMVIIYLFNAAVFEKFYWVWVQFRKGVSFPTRKADLVFYKQLS